MVAKFVKISNKGTTFDGAWDVYEVEFMGENIPNKIYDAQISTNPLGIPEDGTCLKARLVDGQEGPFRPW